MLHFSRWKTLLIWFVVLVAVLIAAPNFLPVGQSGLLSSWLSKHRVVLGSDLRGGTHVVFEVDRADVARQKLVATVGEISRALRQANIRYTGLTGNDQTVTVKITDPAQVDAAVAALKNLT